MVSTKILGNHLRLLAPPRLFCLKYKGLCGEPELKDSPKIPVQSHQTSHKGAICGYTRKMDDIPGCWQDDIPGCWQDDIPGCWQDDIPGS